MFIDIENRMGAKIESTSTFKSGWAGEIVSLKFENNPKKFVGKTYNNTKDGLESIRQEWRGLNFLYQAGYPVPRPILHNFEHEKPYIVMEQIDGENLWTAYEKASEETQHELLTNFVQAFFHLHSLDASIADDELAKESTLDFIGRELTQIEIFAAENNIDGFRQIIDWLHQEKGSVANEKLSILHRDYHPWNVIVDGDKKVTVIDLVWGVGDYRFDLAWLCTLMERGGFDDFSQAALSKYRELKQNTIHNLDYFKVLASLRWLINVAAAVKTGKLNETRKMEANKLINKAVQTMKEITKRECGN